MSGAGRKRNNLKACPSAAADNCRYVSPPIPQSAATTRIPPPPPTGSDDSVGRQPTVGTSPRGAPKNRQKIGGSRGAVRRSDQTHRDPVPPCPPSAAPGHTWASSRQRRSEGEQPAKGTVSTEPRSGGLLAGRQMGRKEGGRRNAGRWRVAATRRVGGKQSGMEEVPVGGGRRRGGGTRTKEKMRALAALAGNGKGGTRSCSWALGGYSHGSRKRRVADPGRPAAERRTDAA